MDRNLIENMVGIAEFIKKFKLNLQFQEVTSD